MRIKSANIKTVVQRFRANQYGLSVMTPDLVNDEQPSLNSFKYQEHKFALDIATNTAELPKILHSFPTIFVDTLFLCETAETDELLKYPTWG